MLLKDKIAVISGGAGINGLGFATARQMAAHGARVVILDLARAEPAGSRQGSVLKVGGFALQRTTQFAEEFDRLVGDLRAQHGADGSEREGSERVGTG